MIFGMNIAVYNSTIHQIKRPALNNCNFFFNLEMIRMVDINVQAQL